MQFILFPLVAVLALAAFPGESRATPEETRMYMNRITSELKVVLPLWMDEANFDDPELQAKLKKALMRVTKEIDRLEEHGQSQEATFALFAKSLRNDATDIQRFLEDDNYEGAHFMVGQLLENCVGCHSRLPSTGASPLGNTLTEGIDVDALPVTDRLKLRLATRQFDRAIDDFEHVLLEAAGEDGRSVSLQNVIADYLIVNVRVRNDLTRPHRFLSEYAKNPALGKYTRSEIELWARSLGEIREMTPDKDPIAHARKLYSTGKEWRLFPAEDVGLAYDIAASGALYRYLQTRSPEESNARLAEAYYLLGASEAHIRRPTWNERWDEYLELAIRTDPGSDTAGRAYRVLEDETLAFWSPSWTATLPSSVRDRLDALRELTERAPM